jgi:hypothetical protein
MRRTKRLIRNWSGCAEARHGRRQDYGNGDAYRMADGERRPPSGHEAVYQGLPRRPRRIRSRTGFACAAQRSGEHYRSREIVPEDMIGDLGQAKIASQIITHSSGKGRAYAQQGPGGGARHAGRSARTDGALVRRVAGSLMGMKNILVLNDEAHHCYREGAVGEERRGLKGTISRGEEQQRGRAAVDLRIEAMKRSSSASVSHRPFGDALLLKARLSRRARCSAG